MTNSPIFADENQSMKPRLTRREKEVLEKIAAGLTVVRVSQLLGVSATTVQTHLRNAKEKLQTTNSVHTVVEAIRTLEIVIRTT